MSLFSAFLLGLIQGVTEFLPISSDGHLVIAQGYLPGFRANPMTFDVMLHFGTLLAVVCYFWRDIIALAAAAVRERADEAFPPRKWAWLVVVASLPTGLIGLSLEKSVEHLFASPTFAAAALLVNGALLLATGLAPRPKRGAADLNGWHALLIGIMQGLAVLPGISRSSNTIATAMFLGVRGEIAARFSFLISIPAVAGAVALKAKDLPGLAAEELLPYAVGTAVALASGMWAIGFLFKAIARGKFRHFGYYCLILGGAVLLLEGWRT